MKIRQRAYLLGLLPALSVALVLGIYLGVARLADLRQEIDSRGAALARHLATTAEYGVVSGNRADLRNLLAQVRAEPDVARVEIRDTSGRLLAAAGQAASDPLHFTALVIPRFLNRGSDPFLMQMAQAAPDPAPVASVNLTMSRARFIAARNHMLVTAAGIVLLGLIFASLLVRKLALTGIRPVMELIAAVKRMAMGDLNVEVAANAKSELRDLQMGFNRMSAALLAYRNDMQRQVEAATAELAAQKLAAEAATAAKSYFLAAASHDLRQPMHAIGLYVEAMRPLVQGRRAAHTLEKLAASVTALEGLFNAILDVSRLDAGAVEPMRQPIRLEPFLHNLADSLQMDAEYKGLSLRVATCPGFIDSDPQLLERILRNLLSNALRYTERGGVLLTARRCGQAIVLQVWDTGVGIPDADLPCIMDEFYQVKNPQRDRSQGLGLGLAIVRRLALLLQHPLKVRSRPGRGSVFSLTVPRSANPDRAPVASGTLPDFTHMQGRIAVVDDDRQVLDALVSLLTGWGLHVTAATSYAALDAQLDTAPDVLLTDWRLAEGETGQQVVEKLRARFHNAAIPVLIITGDAASETDAPHSDMAVLHKPVKPARLRTYLMQLLRAGN